MSGSLPNSPRQVPAVNSETISTEESQNVQGYLYPVQNNYIQEFQRSLDHYMAYAHKTSSYRD